MKEIIIFAKSLSCGGTEKALVSLLKAIDYSIYNVTLELLDKDEFFIKQVPKEVNIQYINFKNEYDRAIVSWDKKYILNPRNILGLIKRLYYRKLKNRESLYKTYLEASKRVEENTKKYDIALDFHGYGYFFTTYIEKCINSDKKVTWIHDEHMEWLKSIEESLSEYDKIFCVSNACKSNFDKLYPQFKEKSQVFYNIINITEIIDRSIEFKPQFNKKCCNIVTVGRLVNQKGYDLAIEISRKLKKNNFKFCWYFIGEGSERKKLENLISKYNLGNNVKLLGKMSNPYPYIKEANIYIQPSRNEGYPIAIIEARALKKIILASKIPSISEQIIDGVNGYLLERKSDLYVDKIKQIYKNPESVNDFFEYMKNENIDFSDEIDKLYNMCI